MSEVDPIERKNACRHFLGMYPDKRPSCARGWDVRKWAVRCNGGSNLGIGLRLPCTKRAEGSEKPLFDCPSLDRKTNAEMAEQRKEMGERMNRIISGMKAIQEIKAEMIEAGLGETQRDCPWCGSRGSLVVLCAINHNKHVHCKCENCGEGFIE